MWPFKAGRLKSELNLLVLVGRVVIIILNLRFSKSCQISKFSSLPSYHITLRSSCTHSCIHNSSLYISYSHAELILLIHHSFSSYITHPPHTSLIHIIHHSFSSYITHPYLSLILLTYYSSDHSTFITNTLIIPFFHT